MSISYKEGYVYHIKDEYFTKANDEKLMQNKENRKYRPSYYCWHDEKTHLLWMIPISSQIDKFKKIYNKQLARYGKCLTIVFGEFGNQEAAFLLQNMFPITESYLEHIHTINNHPVSIKHSLQKELQTKMKQLLHLINRGNTVVFPDVKRLEQLMLNELNDK